ncbi:MAG TPA: P-loop NTPase fold protein, partial [Bacteroidia bacterium]|nr:P-loop NTPase fold protein [Bacteroidia bacterium]
MAAEKTTSSSGSSGFSGYSGATSSSGATPGPPPFDPGSASGSSAATANASAEEYNKRRRWIRGFFIATFFFTILYLLFPYIALLEKPKYGYLPEKYSLDKYIQVSPDGKYVITSCSDNESRRFMVSTDSGKHFSLSDNIAKNGSVSLLTVPLGNKKYVASDSAGDILVGDITTMKIVKVGKASTRFFDYLLDSVQNKTFVYNEDTIASIDFANNNAVSFIKAPDSCLIESFDMDDSVSMKMTALYKRHFFLLEGKSIPELFNNYKKLAGISEQKGFYNDSSFNTAFYRFAKRYDADSSYYYWIFYYPHTHQWYKEVFAEQGKEKYIDISLLNSDISIFYEERKLSYTQYDFRYDTTGYPFVNTELSGRIQYIAAEPASIKSQVINDSIPYADSVLGDGYTNGRTGYAIVFNNRKVYLAKRTSMGWKKQPELIIINPTVPTSVFSFKNYLGLLAVVAFLVMGFLLTRNNKTKEVYEKNLDYSKARRIHAQSDTPQGPDSKDSLGFKEIENGIVNLIENPKISPLTIVISGEWGSGKSSLMNRIRWKLEGYDNTNTEGNEAKNKNILGNPTNYITTWFNAWHLEGEQSLLTTFLLNIVNEYERSSTSFKYLLGFRWRLFKIKFFNLPFFKQVSFWVTLTFIIPLAILGFFALFSISTGLHLGFYDRIHYLWYLASTKSSVLKMVAGIMSIAGL